MKFLVAVLAVMVVAVNACQPPAGADQIGSNPAGMTAQCNGAQIMCIGGQWFNVPGWTPVTSCQPPQQQQQNNNGYQQNNNNGYQQPQQPQQYQPYSPPQQQYGQQQQQQQQQNTWQAPPQPQQQQNAYQAPPQPEYKPPQTQSAPQAAAGGGGNGYGQGCNADGAAARGQFCSTNASDLTLWYVATSWIPCRGGGFKRAVSCVQCAQSPFTVNGVTCPTLPETSCNAAIKPLNLKDGCTGFNFKQTAALQPKA